MSTNWQINTANTGAQMPGVASLLQNQSSPPLVSDAQYRGEPLAPADPNATSYSSVGMAPPPAAVATPMLGAPASPSPTTGAAPASFADWLKTQQGPKLQTYGNPLEVMQQNRLSQTDWSKQRANEYLSQYGNSLTPEQLVNVFNSSPEWWPQITEETEGGAYNVDDINVKVGEFNVSKGAVANNGTGYNSYTNSGAAAGYSFSKPNDPYTYSYDQSGKFLNKSTTDWLGNGWLTKTYDSQGNKLGEHFEKKYKSGLGNFLKTIAPIALGVLAPGVGSAIGGALSSAGITGLANTLATGAIIGGGTSALTGGNVLKGAALGGLGAGVSSGIGSLTSGLDPAIVKAAQGAGSSLVRGAVTGNLDPTDILASAGTGYLSDSVRSVLEDFSPTQNLYEQNIAPGIKPETSVAGFIENIGRKAAVNAPGTLIRGGDLGDMLTNTAIGEAAKTATGYVPKTGDDFIDRLTGGATSALVSSGLRDIVTGDDKSPAAPKTVASADKETAPQAGSETSPQAGSQEQVLSELMAMLGGGGSSSFIPTNDYDLGRAFSAARATREAAARNRQMEMQIAALLGRGQA